MSWKDLFGPPSEDQAGRDVDRGEAQPRNSGEAAAAADYYKEAYETESEPLSKDTSDSDSGGKSK